MDNSALEQALSLYLAGRLEEAAQRCQSILRREPDQLEATYILGKIHLDWSNVATALSFLRRAVQIAPDWPEAHANLGAALFLRKKMEEATYHIRRATLLDPEDPEAQNNLGVALQTAGRSQEAEAAFLAALRLHPQYPDALQNLGQTLHVLGRYSEARERFREALLLNPDNPDILFGIGVASYLLGEYDAAEQAYRQALERLPGFREALASLEAVRAARDRAGSLQECLRQGDESLARGDLGMAEAAYRQALALSPDDPKALHALGLLLLHSHRAEQAQPLFERLLIQSNQDADAYNDLGVTLGLLGDKRQAASLFQKAVEIDAKHSSALLNLANALTELGAFDEALPICHRALALSPDNADIYTALGAIYAHRRDSEAAAANFESALRLTPQSCQALNNLGFMRYQQGDMVGALRLYRRALALNPDFAEALNNVSNIYFDWGRREAGEEMLRKALALSPGSANAHFNLAVTALAQEQYEEGWSEYEWRFGLDFGREPDFGAPKWRGEANPTGTLLIYPEQGFGDSIQFVRYLGMAKRRWRGRVVFYCRPELFTLFEGALEVDEVVSHAVKEPYPQQGYDAFISLMSLPGLFGTVTETIPANVPYLHAPDDRIKFWRDRLASVRERKVGLVWAGNPGFVGDRMRSCHIQHLAPLDRVSGVKFFSLQKGVPAEQLANAPEGLEIIDIGRDLSDFADTAAALSCLDLLISTCTSVPHLAGALGRPVWLALKFEADWRWMRDLEDSPWYPTARLFRQPHPGEWPRVWGRIADELQKLAEPSF